MGLMGEIASTVYAGLGEENVIGVIPEALQPREVPLLRSLMLDAFTFDCKPAGSLVGRYISTGWIHGDCI